MNVSELPKLTKAQRELLNLLAYGPRDGITDKRVANALGLKGLIDYEATTNTWTISPAGRNPLSEAET